MANKSFFDRVREAYQYTREKLSPTLDAAYSTYKESRAVAGDLVEGTKSAWKFVKAGFMLAEATATFAGSVGKAVFYDAPSSFKAKYYDKDEDVAKQSYDAAVENFTAAGKGFMAGTDAVIEGAQNAFNTAYYAADAAYHSAQAVYHAGNTGYNAALLAAEGTYAASAALVNGAYKVAQVLEEVYESSKSSLSQHEDSVELKPIAPAFEAVRMSASVLRTAEQIAERALGLSAVASAA